MLNAFAASEMIVSRAIIQDVAETFDVLPRMPQVEERESPARIFPAASRAEVWAAGNGNGHSHSEGNGHSANGNGNASANGNGNGNGNGYSAYRDEPAAEFSLISSDNELDVLKQSHADFEARLREINASLTSSGFGRGNNNGQSL